VMEDTRTELENDRLYSVVADLYTGQMLSAVAEKSLGILKLVPKAANGTPVKNFEDYIVRDKEGREVKAWSAIAFYLQSFPKNSDGVSEVPAYYGEIHDRKIVDSSKEIRDILKKPGKYGRMIYGALSAAAAVTGVTITMIVKTIKKRRRKRS
ncbi:MAG: bifunctional metallophosphatase/5'-nucleotidase, partial [Lachnospiraceae bacterium]|nr:bifunctional metallophosphatase/5'-nucleotidase [Lachnospiraceae bacterium]